MSKTYTVMKEGTKLKTAKSLASAKGIADEETAEVYAEGKCVYSARNPIFYRLTALMNVRKAPSLEAEKVGTKPEGTVVQVTSIEGDWLHLADGNYIFAKWAERVNENGH